MTRIVSNRKFHAKRRLIVKKKLTHLKLYKENLNHLLLIDDSAYKEKTRAEIALNSISDGVFCTDVNGNVDYLNVAAEKLTGWSREDAYGRPSNILFNIINGITRKPA